MFKKNQTSAFPWGWRIPPKKSHKKRNALIVTGIAAGATLIAGALNKKPLQP